MELRMRNELVALVTVKDREEGLLIAESLVDERLAACVNLVPAIESVYRWEGKVVRDSEALLIIKTTDERYPELESRVKELHSYTTPEVVTLTIHRGSADYLRWLRESTSIHLM
jgi:periplasmic divalent cation tolerance protein